MNWKQMALVLSGGGTVYVVLAMRVHHAPEGGLELTDPVSIARAEISGTRLKAKYISGADGSQLYVAEVLHDSQLDVDCTFANAADDTKRCIPTAPSSSASDASGRIYYRDSMCKGSAYVWLDPAPQGCTFNAPKYVYSYSQPPYCAPNNVAADALAHIFPVGTLAGPPGGGYFAPNPQGTCGPASGPPNQQQYVHYSLGSELPASSFVAGTVDMDP
jgi:hypothetical protein